MNAFLDALGRMFSTDGFVPRRVCGLWPDWLVWEHVVGNALVWLAYVAMPLIIWRLGARRPDWVPFKAVARAFVLFIGLCGLGHFLDMIAFFHPMYRFSGHVLVATGLASWWTAWSLRRAWPALMAMKSPAELERVIAERTEELTRAIDDLRRVDVDRAYLSSIVETSQDTIVSRDLDGIITSWNAGAVRLFGYEAAEAVGRPITFLIPPGYQDEEPTILNRLGNGERSNDRESVWLTKDGRSIDVSLTISPIKDLSGRIVGFSNLARDVTEKRQAEELLTRSEQKFRLLAESIPQLVWMARPDGHIFWYNQRWYDYTGTSATEMEGWGWQSVNDPEMLPKVLERWKESITEGKPFEMVFPIRGTDGRFRKFLTRVLPSCDAEGRVLGWFGTNTDIDEQKKVEEKIKASERLYRAIGESIPFGVWTCEPNGRNTYASESFLQLVGLTQEQCSSFGWGDVLHPDDAEGTIAAWKECVRTEGNWDIEHRFRGIDGCWHPVLARGVPVRDADGRIVCWAGINLDISRLRQAEDQVRLLNESLEHRIRERTIELRQQVRLIDQAHDAIIVRSREGVISSWNHGAEQLYGWAKEQALGCVSHELLKTHFPRPLAEIEEDLAKLGSWEGDLIHERWDGVQVAVVSRWIVDRENSDKEAVLEINSDITGRREVERALRESRDAAMAATRAKGDFLANMSHEIRTPMNGVLGMTELLLDTQLNDLQRSYVQTVHRSGEALLTVINDILDFSKIEAGKLALESSDFELRDLMDEVADLIEPSARRKNLSIQCRVAREVPRWLVGDPVRIRQVLTNLAGNAIKFTERGGVHLEAHLLADGGDGATIRILVRDTGIGIPEDRQADIFESFTQIEAGNSRQNGGTGLGLTICRSLVAVMGGRIGLDSRPGEGSTFWFEVAFAKGYGAADLAATELEGLRVLVVEDQAADREALREVLLSWECRPEVAASGTEALIRMLPNPNDDPFGVIILNRGMAGLGHEQTARLIKAMPRYAEVPIVLTTLSGPSAEEEVEGGLWAARMAKPIRRSLLYNTLCRAVSGSELLHVRPPAAASEVMKLASPLRILLAEDNEVNREVAIGMVERLGCEAEAVWNGRDLLDALDYDRHDLVLMDVQMPRMDGLAATAAIRERERGTGRHIPIVAMTAHAMATDRERCLAAGMDG